jgi:hypothetical protein
MKDLKSGYIFLSVLLMIALSGTFAVAEYHHVEDCTVCHYGPGGPSEASLCKDSANLKMVREEIETPNSGTKPVVFTGAYVRGAAPYVTVTLTLPSPICFPLYRLLALNPMIPI